MRVDWSTPGYIVREEWQRGKLSERAGGGVWDFERRLEEGRESEIARKCWQEIKSRTLRRGKLSKWEMERKCYVVEKGVNKEEEGAEVDLGEIIEKDREMQREERKKIRESKYNKWHSWIKGERIPDI